MLSLVRFWIIIFILSFVIWVVLRRLFNSQIHFYWSYIISFVVATSAMLVLWLISKFLMG